MNSIEAVVFRGTFMPWSLLIMLATWSLHSHGALLASDGDIMEAVGGGIIKHHVKKPWYAWQRVVPLDRLTMEQRQQMYQRALNRMHISHGYDWRYYLAYLINRPSYHLKTRDVCWEFVAHVIEPYIPLHKNLARVVGRHVLKALRPCV